jgi:catechol 2,3-dioxygenase-like lactoylglutathione lyase family enzyme
VQETEAIMLDRFSVHPTIPAHNLDRARRFYADKLGLTPTSEATGGLVYEYQDSWFLLYPSQGAGTAQHTLMGWIVEDIEAEMRDLRGRGVVFEEYDMPGLKTVNGIASFGADRGAWFKDSEGNILGLVQFG